MATIVKRGRNWYVRFRHAGKEHWESAGPEKRSAERLLAKRITEIAEGRFLDKRKRCTVTFQEFAPRFLEWSKANKRSWKRDRLCVRNLSVRFAGELLSKITLPAVEQYRQARLSGEISFSNKSVTRRTVNIEVKCLHRMLNLATAWGELERNPISGIRMLPEKCSPTRYLSTGEIRRLLEACPQHLQGPVRLALATGMRRQEVIGLTWAEVDRRLG